MALTKIQNEMLNTEVFRTRKNVIINGNFDVWQRGTSFVTSGYCADRWKFSEQDGTATLTRQTFTLGQTNVPNDPTYYLNHDQTVSASTKPFLEQRVESVRTFANKTVTVSFYGKVGASTVVVNPLLRQHFGTTGSPSADVDTTATDITLTTSWQKFTRTITLPSISGKTLGSDGNDYLGLVLQFPSSATYSIDIAQVQVEEGDIATNYEMKSIGEEISLCQRYYSFGEKRNVFYGSLGAGGGQITISFLSEMRVTPSVTSTVISENSTFVSNTNITTDGFNILYTTATTGQQDNHRSWTADAEL